MSNLIQHPYHLVDESPWPWLSSIFSLGLTASLVHWFYSSSVSLLMLNMFFLLCTAGQWWRDVSREASLLGLHSNIVEQGMRWGMLLFITSEVFFFFSFFWAYFHSSTVSSCELGSAWPPLGLIPFNPYGVPLLNTIILLSSGVSVTWAHHALMEGEDSQTLNSLSLTCFLGMYFTALQGLEYHEASFCFSDSVYGSTFFIATGFHGLHVIVGTLLLSVMLARLFQGSFSANHHFGFEAAAWYWHFVDVVWIFLYFSIYWWSY